MNILISLIPYDHGRSGISVYMRELVAALQKAGHRLTLILEESDRADFPGMETICVPKYCAKPLFSMIYHLFILPWRIRHPRQYDFLLIAAANRRMVAFKRGLFTVAVAHDLSQYHIPGKYDRFRMFYIKHLLPFFVRRADMIVAISHSTENDLRQYWHIPAKKIVCIRNGLSISNFSRSAPPPGEPPAKLSEKPYILYLARLEHPGKNHLNLMRAYEKLPLELQQKYNLVMPGEPWGDCQMLLDYAAYSTSPGKMIFSGFLPGWALPDAYRNAALYVFPSLFEGFGLPLLEAMYYSVPCCCSENGALGEIGAGAATLFDPHSPQSIADAMTKTLTDEALRKQLIEAGRLRVQEFRWDDHAAKLVESVASRRGPSARKA